MDGLVAYGYFAFVWTIVSIVLALGAGITFYFIFIRSKKSFKGFLKVMHDFFTFKTLFLEEIIKVTYMVLAFFTTLVSIVYIWPNPLNFLIVLVGGNVALRILYELFTLLIKICKNTTEINEKLKK